MQNKIVDLVSGKTSVEEIEAEQVKEAEEQARHDAERALRPRGLRAARGRAQGEGGGGGAREVVAGRGLPLPRGRNRRGGAADDSIQSADGDETARERAPRKYENDYASR